MLVATFNNIANLILWIEQMMIFEIPQGFKRNHHASYNLQHLKWMQKKNIDLKINS